ncbi:hypothetical protein [Roseobacter sp. MH60115]|nr:hypothetical protein [Roseobacter sp. MH60115]
MSDIEVCFVDVGMALPLGGRTTIFVIILPPQELMLPVLFIELIKPQQFH